MSSEVEIVKACFGVGEVGLDDSLESVEIVISSSFEEGGDIEGVDILAESWVQSPLGRIVNKSKVQVTS
jgi:hypothetical protein